jgi:hypothetical protein
MIRMFQREAAMCWKQQLRNDPTPWLLEADSPGVRYLALRDLLDVPTADAELRHARRLAHRDGPIAEVLSHMEQDGFWVKPGPGYGPKYRSTVWSVILLAELGARVTEDRRIGRACRYLVDHALTGNGQFTMVSSAAPSGTADCLQGNLLWSLAEMGYEDPRLASAYDWMSRSLTGEGVAPAGDTRARLHYYAVKCGPQFACGANNKLPCAWGAVKVMLAFSSLPASQQTPLAQKAIRQGVDFLFSVNPATAAYPTGYANKPNGSWWKFGFPVFYVTDLLQLMEALVKLGYGNDPRSADALELVRRKQDEQGRWSLEYDYGGKTWLDFGKKKQPNKWVTWRALKLLSCLN